MDDLYNMLESLETTEIKVKATMMIRYLVKSRNVSLNEILKDIKKVNKILDKKENI